MATYTTLSYGSSGDEVKKMQESLISAGYSVGANGATGQYDTDTQSALNAWKKANGLNEDGVADDSTLTKLYGVSASDTAATPAVTQAATQTSKYGYDPSSDTSYQQAMAALQQAQAGKPTYANSYEAQLNDLYEQITGRKDFTYDVNQDALYQQYKDQYVNQGQLAMRDTMGQAAALTGGYGSSYGQSVGQQQYNAYLQQLNEVVPELYSQAYQRYQDQGDALLNQYGMLGDLADDEYSKYQDSLNQYWQNVSYLQGQADDAYSRGLEASQLAYQYRQDAYDNLVDMITNLGYTPTADELDEAGMTDAQYQAYLAYYTKNNPVTTTTSGSGGGGSSSSEKKSSDDDTGADDNATATSDPDSRYYSHLSTMVASNNYSDDTKLRLINSYVQTGKITSAQGNAMLKKAGYT